MSRRRNILRGLRAQLLIPLLGALVLAQAVSLGLFLNERRHAVRTALSGEIAGRIANVIQLLEAAPEDLHPAILRSAESPFVRFSLDDEATLRTERSRAGDRIAAIIRAGLDDGERLIRATVDRAPQHMHPRHPPEHVTGWMREVHRRHHLHDGDAMELAVSVALRDGRWLNVQNRFHRPPLQAAWPSMVAMALTALAIVLVVLWAVQRISAPMKALSEGAERLGRGEDPEPLKIEGPTEVRRVTEAFNMMQDRLTRHVRERTQMLAALGHDLRSPLTAMRLRAEMVDDQETRERLSATIDEMQTMVETTLAYAKSVTAEEPTAEVDLRTLLEGIAEEVSMNGGSMDIEPGDALRLSARPTLLKRALRNVIENAINYGDRAIVRLKTSGDVVQIIVEDNGPGISEDELTRVFEPFVRLEASRSRETGGSGLGLSVARAIIRAHGGDISLANRDEGGLRATISLPR